MKFLSLVLAMVMNFSVLALNVGDQAPCVILDHITADLSEKTQCIRDVENEAHQYTVLEFFSALCSTCRKNLPIFSQLAQDNNQVATFRLVGLDRSESLLRNYRNSFDHLINFDMALDLHRDARRAYDIISTPTLMILDKNYNVVYKHRGLLRTNDIAEITELLNK